MRFLYTKGSIRIQPDPGADDRGYETEDVISYGRQVVWNQIWRNFCVSDTYEPGSPSKILTVASGLEEGVLKGNEYFDCEGLLNVAAGPLSVRLM